MNELEKLLFLVPTEFRQKINEFFTDTIPTIPDVLQRRIADKFYVVESVRFGLEGITLLKCGQEKTRLEISQVGFFSLKQF